MVPAHYVHMVRYRSRNRRRNLIWTMCFLLVTSSVVWILNPVCILRKAVKVKAMAKNRGMPSMISPAFSTVVILASFVFRPTSTPATYAVAPSSSSVTCTAIFAAFIWRSVGMCVPSARMPLAIIMISRGICFVCTRNLWIRGRDKRRADSRFVPSQWETALHCNDVSHWLGASLESAP